MTLIMGNSAPTTISKPGSNALAGAYEPAGYTPTFSDAFETNPTAGGFAANFAEYPGGHFALVTSGFTGAAPTGGKVCQAHYDNGYTLIGQEPFAMEGAMSPAFPNVYVRWRLQLSGNWVPHPGGREKMCLVQQAGFNKIILWRGDLGFGSDFFMSLQGLDGTTYPGGAINCGVNVGPHGLATFARWHDIELRMGCNTAQSLDGTLSMKVNGTLVCDYGPGRPGPGIRYTRAGDARTFGLMDYHPVYGGSSPGNLNCPGGMNQWMDSVYASGHS